MGGKIMKVELDMLLKDPNEGINLESIYNGLFDLYKVLSYSPNHYMILNDESTNSTIRVHEDGRVYVKIDPNTLERKDFKLTNLIIEMNKFIRNVCPSKKFSFERELNFSFYGAAAHSYYWKKQNELKEIGKEKFDKYNIRTFSFDEDSIHIKLEECKNI
jgi:hypothetical protein